MVSKSRIQISNFDASEETIRKEKGILGRFNEKAVLTFTPFSLKEHGKILHSWCNKPYSAKFWNMAGSYAALEKHFEQRQHCSGVALSLYLINDQPLAFTETYPIIGSELQEHIPAATDLDYGIHFLMAPPRSILEKYDISSLPLTFFTFKQALRNLYQDFPLEHIYAEPDIKNAHALSLAKLTGFKKIKEIELPDKTAALMQMDKEEFLF